MVTRQITAAVRALLAVRAAGEQEVRRESGRVSGLLELRTLVAVEGVLAGPLLLQRVVLAVRASSS